MVDECRNFFSAESFPRKDSSSSICLVKRKSSPNKEWNYSTTEHFVFLEVLFTALLTYHKIHPWQVYI
jgi:hypothetical protein